MSKSERARATASSRVGLAHFLSGSKAVATYLAYTLQHKRLAIVVAVRTDAEAHFGFVLIGVERRRETENRILDSSETAHKKQNDADALP